MVSSQVSFLLTLVMLVMTFDCGNCNRQQIGKVVSILSNSVSRVEDSTSILHLRSNHRSRRSVLNSSEIQEAIDAHNRLRRLEGASDMELMVWDNDLAVEAEISTEMCIWSHTNVGQNLFATDMLSPIDLTFAIEAWYNEKPYYMNYSKTGICYEPQKQCLHYSQVVWATSRKLGCAYTRCAPLQLTNFTNALLLVCNYDPPGNIVGEMPFQTGTECTRCASGSWWCNNGLCDQSCYAAGPTCVCNATCQNSGSLNSATCTCSCAPGWYGSDCSDDCEDKDPMCDPQPGQYGYPPSYCSDSNYGPQIQKLCPKMCGICQGFCNVTCQNSGSLSRDTCSCSCAPGFYGSDCSDACMDKDPQCNPQPGKVGYPPSYCSNNNYGPQIQKLCPKMCGICQAPACTTVCYNSGSVNTATCSCSCAPGWNGPNCSAPACTTVCYNSGSVNTATCSCSCAPGWSGPNCSAIGKGNNFSTSTKHTLLLTMLALWLSPYSLENI